MALNIKPSLLSQIPSTVQGALSKLSPEDQNLFQRDFEAKAKSVPLYVVLAIFFPIQLFLLGKTGLGIAFVFTFGGFGLWWLIEIFLTSKRVREWNNDLATEIMTNIKIMNRDN